MHSVMRWWPFTWTALMPMPTSKMWCKLTIIMTIIVVNNSTDTVMLHETS